jgi:exodeoxyribonuclease VII large subunit
VLTTDSNRPLSVSELTARIKQMLEAGFAKVEVTGEVSRLTSPASGHLYFTIKDAHAAISAVIWRSTAMRLKNLPEEGGEFVFTGHISLYEPRGSYQLVISRVEAVGAGKLAAEFERRKQSFLERGWFDATGKLSPPGLPKHVGIITSSTAAAFEDVKKVLATRPAWLKLTLAPAVVQGNSAAASIVSAIKHIAAMDSSPDTILLVRGGGSIEDLWCFNDEAVVKAIVECPIPIISGIGHEIDTTLADFAADVRAATPSNAAELCCPSREELRERMPRLSTLQGLLRQQLGQISRNQVSLIQRQTHVWQRHMDACHHVTEQLASRLSHTALISLKHRRSPLRLLEKRLAPLQPVQRLQQQRLLQVNKTSTLHQTMSVLLQHRQQSISNLVMQLKEQARSIQYKRQKLAVLCGELKELDPTQVLERGYSMTYTTDGRLITRATELVPGDAMHVRFRDGTAITTVESVEGKPS